MGSLFSLRHLLALVLCLSLISLPTQSLAEPDESNGPIVSVWGEYLSEADLGDGQVSTASGRVQVTYRDISFEYQSTFFSWDNLPGLPFGNGNDDPWKALHTISLGYQHDGKINQNWSCFGSMRVFSTFEEQMEDSMGVDLMGGVRYRLGSDWELILGAVGRFYPVDSFVLPVAGLSWNQAAQQGFSAEIGFPETSLAYHFDPGLALRLKMLGFDQNAYRLADDSVVEPSGYVGVNDLFAGLQLEYSPIDHLSFEAGVVYTFHRTITTYDQDGDNENEYDADDAWGGALRIVYSF